MTEETRIQETRPEPEVGDTEASRVYAKICRASNVVVQFATKRLEEEWNAEKSFGLSDELPTDERLEYRAHLEIKAYSHARQNGTDALSALNSLLATLFALYVDMGG